MLCIEIAQACGDRLAPASARWTMPKIRAEWVIVNEIWWPADPGSWQPDNRIIANVGCALATGYYRFRHYIIQVDGAHFWVVIVVQPTELHPVPTGGNLIHHDRETRPATVMAEAVHRPMS